MNVHKTAELWDVARMPPETQREVLAGLDNIDLLKLPRDVKKKVDTPWEEMLDDGDGTIFYKCRVSEVDSNGRHVTELHAGVKGSEIVYLGKAFQVYDIKDQSWVGYHFDQGWLVAEGPPVLVIEESAEFRPAGPQTREIEGHRPEITGAMSPYLAGLVRSRNPDVKKDIAGSLEMCLNYLQAPDRTG